MKCFSLILSTLALLMLNSCDRYECEICCCSHNSIAHLTAEYDRQWEYSDVVGINYWQGIWNSLGFTRSYDDLKPKRPDGLRTILYDDDVAIDVRNISAAGGTVYIWGDASSLLVFNNDTEYNVFANQDIENEATVHTRMIDRPSYDGSPYAKDASILTTQPDILYHCILPLEDLYARYDTIQLHALMVPVVYTYAVRIEFTHGSEYIAMSRGALAGMANGVWLWDGAPMNERVSVAFDGTLANNAIESYVNSFGHPIDCLCQRYGLNLELRLTNGKYIDYDIDITEQMRCQPFGGVILIYGLDIPDSVGQQPQGGGFDVTVDGWGEFEDIPIQL